MTPSACLQSSSSCARLETSKHANYRTKGRRMQLTRYDDYPVHQAPYPFSYIPATDAAWDEGYYFGVFDVELGLYLMTGMRINPNSDMLGAHAGISVRGVERTLRLSREWRKNCDTHIGPLRYEFVEPFRDIRLSLGENPS